MANVNVKGVNLTSGQEIPANSEDLATYSNGQPVAFFIPGGDGTNSAQSNGFDATIPPVVNGNNSLAHGDDVTIASGSNQTFAQGLTLSVEGSDSLVHGESIDIRANYSFVQGSSNNLGSSGGGLPSNVLMQGSNNNASFGQSSFSSVLVQGDSNSVNHQVLGNSLIQGSNNTLQGGECQTIFIQGSNNDIPFAAIARSFAQGDYAQIRASDQKVWGSNRQQVGGAQSSRQIKWVETTDNTPTDLFAVTTETGKSYAISGLVIARDTLNPDQTASFLLTRATAYNDAGICVLLGDPISFVSDNSGGNSATWTAVLSASGADFRASVTGSATTIEWCCDIQYVEVANSA